MAALRIKGLPFLKCGSGWCRLRASRAASIDVREADVIGYAD